LDRAMQFSRADASLAGRTPKLRRPKTEQQLLRKVKTHRQDRSKYPRAVHRSGRAGLGRSNSLQVSARSVLPP